MKREMHKIPVRRCRREWEDNIKMYQENRVRVRGFNLSGSESDRWRAVVNTVTNPRSL